jgi:hypothetical protein
MRLSELPPVIPRWYQLGLRYLVHTQDCLLMHVDEEAGIAASERSARRT